MTVEFLNYDTSFDRIVLPYQRTLAKIGIRSTSASSMRPSTRSGARPTTSR